MSRFRIEFLPRAAKDYRRLPAPIQERVARALERLLGEPLAGKPLQGPFAGLRSLRVGEYRVAYRAEASSRTLLVHAIGHRRDVYRP
ncbi:MAG: type II toxin-antitoxin system RelE/ParE family toxin [Elusimicrobia bacterium]|nr:type II toxin-antitoxin system RelE/ParE family toxin [Elusimicrobiota bacterium]